MRYIKQNMTISKDELSRLGLVDMNNTIDNHVPIYTLLDGHHTMIDLINLAGLMCTKEKIVQFIVGCFELVDKINVPLLFAQSAIDAAQRWLREPTKNNARCAAHCAYTSYDACVSYARDDLTDTNVADYSDYANDFATTNGGDAAGAYADISNDYPIDTAYLACVAAYCVSSDVDSLNLLLKELFKYVAH